MATIQRRDFSSKAPTEKVAWKFDVSAMDMYVKYSISSSVKMPEMSRLLKLMNNLDMDAYRYNPDVYNRIELVKLILEARCVRMISDMDTIRSFIVDNNPDLKELLEQVNWNQEQLTSADIRAISKNIVDKIEYSTIMVNKRIMMDIYDKLEKSEAYNMPEEIANYRATISKMLIEMQNTNIVNGLVTKFELSSPDSGDAMNVIVEKAKRPGSILQTGIRQLNSILSPGFQSGRLYTFMGNSGGFKSGTLLNVADQIRKFNSSICNDGTTRRKVILFVTMENTISQTFLMRLSRV